MHRRDVCGAGAGIAGRRSGSGETSGRLGGHRGLPGLAPGPGASSRGAGCAGAALGGPGSSGRDSGIEEVRRAGGRG